MEFPLDQFYEDYTLVQNHLDSNASFDGALFETYGEQLDFVNSQKTEHVWTYLDSDDVIVVVPGKHTVNRLGYLITHQAWTNENIEYTEHF